MILQGEVIEETLHIQVVKCIVGDVTAYQVMAFESEEVLGLVDLLSGRMQFAEHILTEEDTLALERCRKLVAKDLRRMKRRAPDPIKEAAKTGHLFTDQLDRAVAAMQEAATPQELPTAGNQVCSPALLNEINRMRDSSSPLSRYTALEIFRVYSPRVDTGQCTCASCLDTVLRAEYGSRP